jgi:hypothetical protein
MATAAAATAAGAGAGATPPAPFDDAAASAAAGVPPLPVPPPDPAVERCVGELAEWVSEAAPGLDAAALAFCTPATLRRYAVARNGDFDAAVKNLEATLAWRAAGAVPPSPLHCPACDTDPHMHAFFPVGIDAHRRVVVYACAARAKTNETEVTVRHMVQTLEHAWRATEALGLHHQWVWLVDFAGFGLRHALQGRTSNAALASFSAHMPERLGAVVLLNPPGVFDLLLAAVKPFVDARTMAKVHIARCTPDTAAAVLRPHGIPPDGPIAKWMAAVLAMPGTPGSLPPLDGLDAAVMAHIALPRMPPGTP